MQQGPYWLSPDPADNQFPPTHLALDDPNGLLAIGGELTPQRLLAAYRLGIFPWYSEGQPPLWWSPSPRTVIFPERLRVSRSLRKSIRNRGYRVTLDRAFSEVIRACSAPRSDEGDEEAGGWILPEMIAAYERLHQLGHAHSVECWHGEELVGGLYGIAIGGVFFGESMFSRRRDASKVAFARLVGQLQAWGVALIDCQVNSDHLASLGAEEIDRDQFESLLSKNRERAVTGTGRWDFDNDESVEVEG